MALSINSVIHYTDRMEHLKSIIECGGFRLKYCLEEIIFGNEKTPPAAYPMVCFCDIPLSEVKNHIDTYGSYGIGLTKKWAKINGLNPVLYLENNSRLTQTLAEQADRLGKQLKQNKLDNDLLNDFFKILSYCKNYEGRLVKGKINDDAYRSYNEREWRIVALKEDINGEAGFIHGENYVKNKQEFNDKLKECYIKFDHSDISYLIVDNEDEIPEILKAITEKYEDCATSKDLKILSTRILTKNQIWNDF